MGNWYPPRMSRVVVLGIGNVLMGDDALGPHVVKQLQAGYVLPDHVTVVEGGTPGVDLAAYLKGVETLVVVDTLRLDAPPGTLHVLDKSALLASRPVQAMNLHEPGLREALLTMEFEGGGPREVRLVGVVPSRVDGGIGLSRPVRDALPQVLARTLSELAALGVEARKRQPPGEPDLWWERDPALDSSEETAS